jgi:hypothetical protein
MSFTTVIRPRGRHSATALEHRPVSPPARTGARAILHLKPMAASSPPQSATAAEQAVD